tara:strand:+ start:179 stop:400 length:222 start_codon:yes stop_codon:yes gene_type:complete
VDFLKSTLESNSNDKILKCEKNFMSRLSTIKELFELYIHRRKFYMFPILILLIALIGVTALTQSGLVAFIYPI